MNLTGGRKSKPDPHGFLNRCTMRLDVLRTVQTLKDDSFTWNRALPGIEKKGEPMSAQFKRHALASQQLHADRLIIATNRGPVEYYLSQDNELKHRRGAGGLVTALLETGTGLDVRWVALAMTEGDRRALQEARQNGGLHSSPLSSQRMQLRYVAVPKTVYQKYYEQISNRVLWFLQHYLYDPSAAAAARGLQDAWANGYTIANQAVAQAVTAEIEREEGSVVVMVHDYHLYLAPTMIRRHHPKIVIHHFMHIPWPDVRCWQFLPSNVVQDIYRGLMGNDIIGFQAERDARNFLEGARTLLEDTDVDFEEGTVEWQGHLIRARAYPISVSVEAERQLVRSMAGKRAAQQIRPLLCDKTIMRVDRIDPTKNIVRGFQAYAQMLEEHPELHGKVRFLAFLVPSRQSLPEYKRYYHDVLKLIEAINSKYGTDEWRPIYAFCENDRTRALAALQFYDVLLVNPLIDGMNLVAKEGPVVNERNGVLVLSRTAGAFQQLAKAQIDDLNAVLDEPAVSRSLVEEPDPPALTASVI